MTLQSELSKLWPSVEEVENCVKGDAEAASSEVLLAVHQAMELRRRDVGSKATGEKCREEDLFQALLAPSGDGRVILPVVGTSGVGKSHVIRWIFARLKQRSDASQRVVIRIPRNTSLKGVLAILLEHESLKGPKYEKHRLGLTKAQEELDPHNAANLLCEMLAQELVAASEDAKRALEQGRSDPLLKRRAEYGNAAFLPALLRHPVLRDGHWLGPEGGKPGPIRLLLEQLLTSGAPQDEDKRKQSFEPNDLDISDLGVKDVGHAAAKMLGFLRRPDTREAAAAVLNTVIDSAKSSILRMDPTVGKMFEDIRVGLLEEKKELVLLIEDFATTSGLQAQLVQAMLKEGVRDGKPVLCMMRTALAYTPGSFDPPDTFKTRAGAEWYVSDDPGTHAELSQRARNMVGAYLNAARIGVARLTRAAAGATSMADRSWIPTAELPDGGAGAVLGDFGNSDDGYPLFPFNAAAIDKWLEEGSIREEKVVYNPRFIIKNILRKVLVWRPEYVAGTFPPQDLTSPHLRPVEEEKLHRLVQAKGWDKDYPRYRILLGYWFSDARTFAEASSRAERTLSAFQLPWESGPGRPIPRPTAPAPNPSTPLPDALPPPPSPVLRAPKRSKEHEELEGWRVGADLSQATSRRLRGLLWKALVAAEPLDWFPSRSQVPDKWAEDIWIPHSFGVDIRKEEDASTAVCSDAEYAQPERRAAVAAALTAFFRFESNGRTWNYDEADEDLPRYCGLVSRMLPRFRKYLASRPLEVAWDPLPTIVSGLLLSGRALGVESANSVRAEDVVGGLFEAGPAAKGPPISATVEASAWSRLQETFRELRTTEAASASTSWRALLLDLVGAHQGAGKAVYALDIARLKPALDAAIAADAFIKPSVEASKVGALGVRLFKYLTDSSSTLSLNKIDKALDEECSRIKKWHAAAEGALGSDFGGHDKDRLCEVLRKTVTSAESAGYLGAARARFLGEQVTKFQGAQVVEAMRSAASLAQATKRMDRLRELGKSQESVHRALDELATAFSEYFTEVETKLRAEEGTLSHDPIGEANSDMKAELTAWVAALKEDA